MNTRDLECRVVVQERQQAGETTREHRLAGAGRSGEQQVVPARRGDLEGSTRAFLAADVGQVGNAGKHPEVVVGRRRLRRVVLAAQVGDDLAEVPHTHRLDTGQCHFRGRLERTDKMCQPCPACPLGGDERPGNRTQPPVETEFAERRMPVE